MTSDGDLALTRLASYSSPSNMPVSSRLTFTSSYSSYAPRASSFRASSLERGAPSSAYSSPLSSKIGSSSRLTPGIGYASSSRRPPLPSSDVRRVAAARASPGRPPPGSRREPSTDPDTLTEARRYLQERRDRLTRSESREPGVGSTSALRSSALATSSSGADSTSSTSRFRDRLDSTNGDAPAAGLSTGSLSRRWRSGEPSSSPATGGSRERVVPITLSDYPPSVSELRRQFDAARIADSRSAEDEASVTREAVADRVIGGRTDQTTPAAALTSPISDSRAAKSASGTDKEPTSPLGRRPLISDRDVSIPSSRRPRADRSEDSSAAAGRGATVRGSDTSRTLGLTGLRNIGNTCFMNSVLQCLSNTRALHDYVLRDAYSADINSTSSAMKGVLIKAFASLMCELWRSGGDTERVLTTAPFKAQVQRFAPRFMGYQQQDAQEFLRYLLEGLHEDVNRVTNRPKPITTDIDENLSASQMSMEAWKRFLRFENSKFVDLFVGQLKSTLRCTVCGHASMTFDPFWDLSLPIPSKSGQVRLQSCFDLFTKEEVLDGDEKPTCSKCKKRQKCTKGFSIQKFPRILVVHLKRFSPMERFRGKLGTAVDFPATGLDLSQYSAGQGPCRYNLYGVANHSGTLFSGHYTAHCKHPYSGDWYEYNDSRVKQVTTRAINSAEAYVLFFELSGSSHL